MIKFAYLATASAAAVLAAPAAAAEQDTAPAAAATALVAQDGRMTVYQAAFFAQYAPRSALDIAKRVPGFTLDLGATQTNQGQVDVRGFAGTAGNVVINGARPSSKAETLDVTLAKIPAQQVLRVELGPGDLYGSDYAGKSQVLNIIMSAQGGFDANLTASANRWFTGYVNTDISGSASIRRGASTINLSGGTGRNRQLQEGPDFVTNVLDGTTDRAPAEVQQLLQQGPVSVGELGARARIRRRLPAERPVAAEQVRPVPEQPRHPCHRRTPRRQPIPALSPAGDRAWRRRDASARRRRDQVRGAGDAPQARRRRYHRSAQRADRGQCDRQRRLRAAGQGPAQRDDRPAELDRAELLGLSFEAGAEAAYNTLDDHVAFSLIDEHGERVPIPLPIEDATVKEKRGEVYVSVGRNLSPALRIDGGVNYEFSNLKVRGDALPTGR